MKLTNLVKAQQTVAGCMVFLSARMRTAPQSEDEVMGWVDRMADTFEHHEAIPEGEVGSPYGAFTFLGWQAARKEVDVIAAHVNTGPFIADYVSGPGKPTEEAGATFTVKFYSQPEGEGTPMILLDDREYIGVFREDDTAIGGLTWKLIQLFDSEDV